MEGIKNILFDLGGVLYHIDYQLTKKAFENMGIENFDSFYSQHKQNTLFDDLETGKISSEEFVVKMMKILPEQTEEKIIEAWNALLIGFTNENLKLVGSLAKTYSLYLLSNTNAIHIARVNDELRTSFGVPSIDVFFKKTYLSHEIGRRKPDVDTFEWVLKDAGIKAEETLFIDDSIQHIDSASKLGIKTLHWASNEPIKHFFLDKAQ